MVEGDFAGHVIFPEENAFLRTDYSFREQINEEHHLGKSVLEQIPAIDMIQNFPLDPMHLVFIGIIKKLISSWLKGSLLVRLGQVDCTSINKHLLKVINFILIEFVRNPRGLDEFCRWKATELSHFLLYLGP